MILLVGGYSIYCYHRYLPFGRSVSRENLPSRIQGFPAVVDSDVEERSKDREGSRKANRKSSLPLSDGVTGSSTDPESDAQPVTSSAPSGLSSPRTASSARR